MSYRIVLLVVALVGAPAAAQPHAADVTGDRHDDARPMSFAEALRAAVVSPELRAGADASRAWRAAVSARSAPSLRASAAPGWSSTGPALELEVGAGWTPGRATAGRAAARSAVDALEAGLAVERRARLHAAAMAWLASWSARARLALADEELARAEALVELAGRGRALGVSTRVDEAAAAAYQLEIHAVHLDVEGEVIDAELALAAAIGAAEAEPVRADGEPPTVAIDGPLQGGRAVADRAEAEAARRAGRAARAQAARQLELGARLELAAEAVAGFATVGLSWPGADRGGLDAAAATARAAVLDGRADAAERADAIAQTRARHEVEHARSLLDVRTRRVAALAEHVAALDASVAAGEAILADVIPARRALALARAEALAARAAVAAAEIERALLAGWEGP